MAKILAKLNGLAREDWLALRRRGIGGSDAAAVVGASKYTSRLALWADKTGRAAPAADSPRLRLGRDLEQYVAERFCEMTGKAVSVPEAMYAHDDFPFIIANLDRLVVGENAGLECKTANFSFGKFPENSRELPESWLCQCRHYLNVMGFELMYLAVLDLGSGIVRVFSVFRDEKCAELLRREVDFWNDFVLAGRAPEPDGSDSAEGVLKDVCKPVSDECAELSEYSDIAYKLYAIREQLRKLEGDERALRQKLIAALGGRKVGVCGGYRISLSQQSRTTVDSKLLKRDFPEAFEKCSKTGVSNVFKIAEK